VQLNDALNPGRSVNSTDTNGPALANTTRIIVTIHGIRFVIAASARGWTSGIAAWVVGRPVCCRPVVRPPILPGAFATAPRSD